jgi:putative Mg2+ transporter-C (MgtC) family protein
MAIDLQHYWSGEFLAANAFIGLNLVGALLLGMLVGYERSYNGRAAGMRLYGLVRMASTALTVFVGHPALWYGGTANPLPADPTRVVQGVVTGIGFLGAGVIMKDGLSISGLTTAASIWAASAIGVLLGVGFYAAALWMAMLCMLSMSVLHRIEARLPGRSTLEVCLAFGLAAPPSFADLVGAAQARGYHVRRSRAHVAVLRGERGPGPRRVAGPAGAGDGRFRGRHQLQHRAGAQLTGAAGSPQPRLADAFAARRIPQQVRSTPMTITLPFRRTPSPRLACLRDVSLFAGLTQPELAIVDSLLHEREYLAHEVIFDEGEVGQAIFFVLDGVVAICLQGSPDDGHLASLGPGEFFGELGLLEDSARSAQAWAAADCRLLALFREDFNDLMDSHLRIGHKIGRQLLRHLGRRLREAGSPGAHRSR